MCYKPRVACTLIDKLTNFSKQLSHRFMLLFSIFDQSSPVAQIEVVSNNSEIYLGKRRLFAQL